MADNNSTFLFLPIDLPDHALVDKNIVYPIIFAGVLIFSFVVSFLVWFFCCRSSEPSMGTDSGDIEIVSADPLVLDNVSSFRFETTSLLRYQEPKCIFCQHEFMLGESLLSLPPCGHTYHSTCIRSYMSTTFNCPLCQQDISS